MGVFVIYILPCSRCRLFYDSAVPCSGGWFLLCAVAVVTGEYVLAAKREQPAVGRVVVDVYFGALLMLLLWLVEPSLVASVPVPGGSFTAFSFALAPRCVSPH